jgi:hypothetical protein
MSLAFAGRNALAQTNQNGTNQNGNKQNVSCFLRGARIKKALGSHIRSAFTPVYDFRKPIDKIRDRIADRAELARAA